MGFWDLFSKKNSQPNEEEKGDKTIVKLQKKLMNKYHQTMERKRIIKMLADIGTEEAISALLGRFTYVTDGSIVDEDEKTLVYEIIREFGNRAVRPLANFIKTEVAIYWPLKALTEIAGEEYAIKTIFESLDLISDRWERSMERLTNLVSCLRDYHQPQVMERLMALVKDESEEIRYLAVDGLSTFDDHPEAVEAILDRLMDDQETTRVKTFVLDLLLERRWRVKKYKKDLQVKLPEDYFIDDTGMVQRRS